MSRSTSATRYFSGTVAIARPDLLLQLLPFHGLFAPLGRVGELRHAVLQQLLQRVQAEPVPAAHPPRISFLARFAAIVNSQVENFEPRR